MRLVLFDIDGTLLSDGGASREAFAAALKIVYGYRGDVEAYDFSGRTDPQIAHMVLADAGYSHSEIEGSIGGLWENYLERLAGSVTRERVRVLAGIRELVDILHLHDDVVLALLTGNIEQGARLKLGGAGLNDYFPFGAFGSDSSDRTELPPIAVARAAAARGTRFDGRDVVIIGDSIYDVRCGVPWQATTIAVASGRTPIAILREENPTHLFESVAETEAVLAAILDQPLSPTGHAGRLES
ncbi:MAG TPA: haloacid dehalogenase-like hydrolase [Thermoanaerobaculia bacterium]